MELVTIQFEGVEGDLKLDSAEIQVPEDQVPQAKALIQNIYDANKLVLDRQSRIDELEGECDVLKAQVEDSSNVSAERLDVLTRERAELIQVATHVGMKEDDLKADANDVILRKTVAMRVDGLAEDASDDYVKGCFNMIRADMARTNDNRQKHVSLARNSAPRRDNDGDGESQLHADGEELTYREINERKLDGMHSKTKEELAAVGLN
jgi:hypothetical protein